MMDTSPLILVLEKEGGLFDFDGTLPLVALQFLALMVVLNLILYTPLLRAINERNQHINKNLATAATLVAQSKQLVLNYEKELRQARKEAQGELAQAQKMCKLAFEGEARGFQTKLEQLLKAIYRQKAKKKAFLFLCLKRQLEALSTDILLKILS